MASEGRERRKTAGLRMSSLVGEALEQDDAFWNHETWNEEDSGNDSFRDSDEDSALKKDEFDSDFDDSETDNEADEEAAGRAEELELQKSERSSKQRRGNYVDVGRTKVVQQPPMGGKRGRGGPKRLMGEGFNAGIVLNFPPPPPPPTPSVSTLPVGTTVSSTTATSSAIHQPQQLQGSIPPIPSATSAATAAATSTAATTTATSISLSNLPPGETPPAIPVPPPSPIKSNRKSGDPVIPRSSLASSRERRSTHGVRKLRENRSTPSSDKPLKGPTRAAGTGGGGSKRKRHYAQEELLLEAVHETEPENLRWLLGRKRTQDQHDKDHRDATAYLRDKQRGNKVIQKFHSRRGCLTTLTFPEMDYVPEILTRKRQPPSQQEEQYDPSQRHDQSTSSSTSSIKKQKFVCVITGKPARYMDPLTHRQYYDVAAFRELRRRHELGIPLEGGTSNNAAATVVTDGPEIPDGARDRAIASSKANTTAEVNGGGKGPPSKKDPGKRPATSSKKSVSDTSKLFFQSPKPAPKPREAASGMQPVGQNNTNGMRRTSSATDQREGSTLIRPVFSWGGVGGDGSAEQSPISPSGRRLSQRKWKPSEKVLETIAMSPRKDGVITTPPGLRIKPQQQIIIGLDGSGGYIPPIPDPPLVPNISASSALSPNVAGRSVDNGMTIPSPNLKHTALPSVSNDVQKSRNETTARNLAVPAGKSSEKMPQTKQEDQVKMKMDANNTCSSISTTEPITTPTAHVATKGSETRPTTDNLKIPSPELQRQLQRLYKIAPSTLEEGGQDSEAQYITQGDLIREAIQTYVKDHDGEEEQPPPEPTQSTRSQEQPIIDNQKVQSK